MVGTEIDLVNPFVEVDAIYRKGHLTDTEGHQWIFRFSNNRGASVIQHKWSYGGPDGLYELAVLQFSGPNTENDWDIDYSTPVTDDVLGRQSVQDIRTALLTIAELPQRLAPIRDS